MAQSQSIAIRLTEQACPRCKGLTLMTDGTRIWCDYTGEIERETPGGILWKRKPCDFGISESKKLEIPTSYRIEIDEIDFVTQKHYDSLDAAMQQWAQRREMLKIPQEDSTRPWKFQLALFPNPMQPGKVFVAEAKEIAAEPLAEYNGRPLFAPYPETPWILPSTLDLDFACELVRRWNRPQGSGPGAGI